MNVDLDLIKACANGNRRAQNLLYKQYYSVLLSTCYRYAGNQEDAISYLNMGFYKILTNLEKYNTDIPFEAWIKRIVINAIIDDFRKNKKHGVLNYKEFQDFESYTDLIDYNQADTDINTEYIYRFINKLPHTSKQVFNLYVVEGYSHKEIAKSLDIAEGTSKWHLSYARKFLQEAILAGTTKTKVLI